jgi:hypothetical protein
MSELEGLTPEELDEQTPTELPDREALSIISANLVGPVHPAMASVVPNDTLAPPDQPIDAVEPDAG